MPERSDIEIAALSWASARIRLSDADSTDTARTLELMQRDREALSMLLSVCTLELAKNEIATVDLVPCRTLELQEGVTHAG